MIDPDSAWKVMVSQARSPEVALHPLGDALGYVLAEAIRADRDLPPADRAAMDGYAVRAADIGDLPAVLPVAAEIAAGASADVPVPAGACVRIFTGANLSPDVDTVVMQEDTEPADDGGTAVIILKSVKPGANVFQQGEDARRGATVLEAGACLDAAGLALCAAVGRDPVPVRRRPTVGLLTTGSELLNAGDPALPHQIRDSNTHFLRGALADQGYSPSTCERSNDDCDRIVAALRRLLETHDVIIMTGGVSVGRYDFVAEAVRRTGARVLFHGVAIKPGKPQLCAIGPNGQLVFGLPGNPLSAMVGFYEFVLPGLHLMAGRPAGACRRSLPVRLRGDLTVKGQRRQYVPARLFLTESGAEAVPVPVHGTADLVAGAHADGAIIVPAGIERVPDGSMLFFRPWRRL